MSGRPKNHYLGIHLEPLLSEADVMQVLQVSRPTLRGLVKKGRIHTIEFMRHRRYSKQDIVDFLEGNAPRHDEPRQLKTASPASQAPPSFPATKGNIK